VQESHARRQRSRVTCACWRQHDYSRQAQRSNSNTPPPTLTHMHWCGRTLRLPGSTQHNGVRCRRRHRLGSWNGGALVHSPGERQKPAGLRPRPRPATRRSRAIRNTDKERERDGRQRPPLTLERPVTSCCVVRVARRNTQATTGSSMRAHTTTKERKNAHQARAHRAAHTGVTTTWAVLSRLEDAVQPPTSVTG
jgi:hypothetical protein